MSEGQVLHILCRNAAWDELDDYDEGQKWYEAPIIRKRARYPSPLQDDMETYTNRRGKRCCAKNCETMVRAGDIGVRIKCGRDPKNDIEARIHGGSSCYGLFNYESLPENWVPLADTWLCHECAGIYIGFLREGYENISPYSDLREWAKKGKPCKCCHEPTEECDG